MSQWIDPVAWPHEAEATEFRAAAAVATPGRCAELIEARVGQLLGSMPSLVEPSILEALSDPSLLTESERCAIAVAEQFVVDVHGLDDDVMAALVSHFGATDAMALLVHLALTDGFTKRRRLMEPARS